MYKQMKQRLAIGFTGALMAGTLLLGALPVAADDSAVEPHDVNIGAEVTGMASESIVTINSVVTPVVTSDTATAGLDTLAPIIEHRDDRDRT